MVCSASPEQVREGLAAGAFYYLTKPFEGEALQTIIRSALEKKQTIDTLKLARSCLSLESNKLDYVSQWLGFSGKDEITNEDWWAAQGGHNPTLKKIERYCVGDVVNGKNVLTKFLPLAHKPAKFGARKK